MTKKEMALIINLQSAVMALASRPYTERAENAKKIAVKVGIDLEVTNSEVADTAGTIADFMEEYYLNQLGISEELGGV